MDIFRIFDWDGAAAGDSFGGPLHVPVQMQGKGRHDIPELDGVLYCALSDVCAVVEAIQAFRGTTLATADFRMPGGKLRRALAWLEVAGLTIPDLANPELLSAHGWSATQVVSRDRTTTQHMAATLFREGAAGFAWPSAISAECRNVTLFQGRVRDVMVVKGPVVPLDTSLPAVQRAAVLLAIPIERGS